MIAAPIELVEQALTHPLPSLLGLFGRVTEDMQRIENLVHAQVTLSSAFTIGCTLGVRSLRGGLGVMAYSLALCGP